MKKLVNYDIVEMSSDEIAELETISKENEEAVKKAQEKQEKQKADKASANKKLKDLGLTDDEIIAITR